MIVWTRKKKIFLIIAIVIVAWIIIARLLVNYTFRFVKMSDSVFSSVDQIDLINSFGYPNIFLLSMDDENRYEVWTYFDMEREFIFMNGEFLDAKPVDSISEDFQFSEFRPTQFKNEISLEDINKILGDPTAKAKVSAEIMQNTELYDYWDQVKVGIQDGEVVFVQTLPVLIPEEFRVQ